MSRTLFEMIGSNSKINMADNYLEKRYAEVFGNGRGKSAPHLQKASLDRLLFLNRSYRGYDKSYIVHQLQLESIVAVNTRLASGMNAQRLRFKLVTKGPEADFVLQNIHLGGALPELHLPLAGTEPEAFIVVCIEGEENAIINIDLGISLQSMLLKAVDLKLGGIIIRNFDKAAIKTGLNLELNPIAILAIGKPAEKIELIPANAGDKLSYYRKDGVHYVPKLKIEELIIK